jgi:hypothetical protein
MLGHIGGREARVGKDNVASRCGVSVLGAVHPPGPGVDELRKVKRHQVVDRRCPNALALRRIHPVGEMEDVEWTDDAFER